MFDEVTNPILTIQYHIKYKSTPPAVCFQHLIHMVLDPLNVYVYMVYVVAILGTTYKTIHIHVHI